VSDKIVIEICMGSSCFARGNRELVPLIKEFIEKNKLDCKLQLKGCLCQQNCKNGPNVKINGKAFSLDQSNFAKTILSFV